MQRRRLCTAYLFSGLIFLLMLYFCSALTGLERTFVSGGRLPADFDAHLWRVTDMQLGDDGSYCVQLRANDHARNVLLMMNGVQTDGLRVNGSPVEAKRIRSATIGVQALMLNVHTGGMLEIQCPPQRVGAMPLMYICAPDTAERFSAVCASVLAVVAGMLLLMAVYALSLFYYHPEKNYLLFFGLYALALFLWVLPTVFSIQSPLVQSISVYVYDFAIVMSLLMCARLCDLQLRGRLAVLYTWYGAVAVSAAVSVLFGLCRMSAAQLDVVRFVLYVGECCLLIHGCARGRKANWVLLIGLLLSEATRLALLIFPRLPFAEISLTLLMIRNLRISVLTFALCGMLFTNRLFAKNYHDTEELSKALEQKVRERTEQLIRQDERRKNFITNIFHDLRSPLFVVQGCLDRLSDRPGDQEALKVAQQKVSFLEQLVHELFQAAKLEDGQLLLDTEPFCLSDIAERIVAASRIVAAEKNIHVEAHTAPGLMGWGDEPRLEEALQNLVTNALYYTPVGQAVFIDTYCEAQTLCFSVRDTGKGIAPEDQEHLFDRYYAVSGSDKHTSSGLGLSIAHEIVKMHQGEIRVESAVGVGSRFLVCLPRWNGPKREKNRENDEL